MGGPGSLAAPLPPPLPAAPTGVAAPAASTAAAVLARADELHGLGVDLGRVPLVAVLVLPLAGLDAAFDVDGSALRQVLVAHLGGAAPDDDAMPLRAFLTFAALVRPVLARGEREVDDGLTVRGLAQLGVTSEVADEDGFVDTCHEWGLQSLRDRLGWGVDRATSRHARAEGRPRRPRARAASARRGWPATLEVSRMAEASQGTPRASRDAAFPRTGGHGILRRFSSPGGEGHDARRPSGRSACGVRHGPRRPRIPVTAPRRSGDLFRDAIPATRDASRPARSGGLAPHSDSPIGAARRGRTVGRPVRSGGRAWPGRQRSREDGRAAARPRRTRRQTDRSWWRRARRSSGSC